MPDVMTASTARLEQKTAARGSRQGLREGPDRGAGAGRRHGRVRRPPLHRRHGTLGLGESTLLHCVAGLDSLTSVRAFIGDMDLSTLYNQRLTSGGRPWSAPPPTTRPRPPSQCRPP